MTPFTNDHLYIACDLGAESGRIVLGQLRDDETLVMEEIHRFPTGATRIAGTLRWNLHGIFEELKAGLKKIRDTAPASARASLSVDSWGVDYVYFNASDPQLSLPYHYRDPRTDAAFERALACVSPETIFAETGIQFMSINTLYQFLADLQERPAVMEAATHFLNVADYLNYLFSGVIRAEKSLASTTQLYNPVTQSWSTKLIEAFQLPPHLFPPIGSSGWLGPIRPEIAKETGMESVDIIATSSHDTASAVAAIPAQASTQESRWAYLSSGTWSLMGVELEAPLINEEVRAANFTNEAGCSNTIRFLKNMAGLWILQECRRAWEQAGLPSQYDVLTQLAVEAEPLRSLIHPADPRFVKPGEMPQKIAAYCRETGQPEPETPGAFVRCILESLALLYRENLTLLEHLTGRSIDTLHIVGGGSKNRLLNQLAANATGVTVLAGPVEATAIGNLLGQALELGHLDSLQHLRDVVRASFPIETFQPVPPSPEWLAAMNRYHAFPRH